MTYKLIFFLLFIHIVLISGSALAESIPETVKKNTEQIQQIKQELENLKMQISASPPVKEELVFPADIVILPPDNIENCEYIGSRSRIYYGNQSRPLTNVLTIKEVTKQFPHSLKLIFKCKKPRTLSCRGGEELNWGGGSTFKVKVNRDPIKGCVAFLEPTNG